MNDSLGKQGSRPGNTRSERLAKARSGAFAGKSYAEDANLRRGPVDIKQAGQGTSVVKKTPLRPEAPTGDPWKRPDYAKPGAY